MTDTDPITLADACEIVFGGRIKPATLRAEAARGRIEIALIGKRYFTTLRAARELFDKCRVVPEARGSISTRRESSGLSETAQLSSARAAANATVARLKSISKPTSAESIGRSHRQRH